MEELFEVWESMQDLVAKLSKSPKEVCGAIICMLVEEWCREHDVSAPDFAIEMASHIITVNMELGRYGKEG